MSTFVFCYDCPLEFTDKLEEKVAPLPFVYLDARPDKEAHLITNTPCVVITTYQGMFAKFEGKFDVTDVFMKVCESLTRRSNFTD